MRWHMSRSIPLTELLKRYSDAPAVPRKTAVLINLAIRLPGAKGPSLTGHAPGKSPSANCIAMILLQVVS